MQERRALVAALTGARSRTLLIPAVAAVIVVVDQISKTWAEHHANGQHVGPVRLTLTLNSGAAFSLGRGVTPVVEAVVVGLVIWLVVLGRRASRVASPLAAVALGLLLGGALGNLADRVLRNHHGAVVDFIQAASWWPVFNVADASIVVGVLVLVLVFTRRPAPTR